MAIIWMTKITSCIFWNLSEILRLLIFCFIFYILFKAWQFFLEIFREMYFKRKKMDKEDKKTK